MGDYKDGMFVGLGITIGEEDELVIPHTKFKTAVAGGRKKVNSAWKRTPHVSFPTSIKYSGSFDFLVTADMLPVLELINSEEGVALTEFSVNDGVWKYTGCKCAGIKLPVKLDEECVGSFDFVAKDRGAGSAVVLGELEVVFVGSDIALTGFADKDSESLDISVANPLKEIYGMKGSSKKPRHLSEGYQNIDVDIKYNEDHDVDLALVTAPIATATVVLNGTDGLSSLTITLTNVIPTDDTKDSVPEDVERFALKYGADVIDFAFDVPS